MNKSCCCFGGKAPLPKMVVFHGEFAEIYEKLVKLKNFTSQTEPPKKDATRDLHE